MAGHYFGGAVLRRSCSSHYRTESGRPVIILIHIVLDRLCYRELDLLQIWAWAARCLQQYQGNGDVRKVEADRPECIAAGGRCFGWKTNSKKLRTTINQAHTLLVMGMALFDLYNYIYTLNWIPMFSNISKDVI